MSPLIHLFIVYIVWGTTFVAMRAVVTGDSGVGPFTVGSTRLWVASAILFGWAFLRGKSVKISRRDLSISAVSGALIWLGGNSLVMWAEQWVDAGYATLVFSTLPIWTLVMGFLIDRKPLSAPLIFALAMAFLGMIILSGILTHRDLSLVDPKVGIATAVILVSALLWALSTHLQKRFPISCPIAVGSMYQQLFGALAVSVMALAMREPFPHPTPRAWLAWGYLVIFGSVIAYGSYVKVVQYYSPAVSMTFAYVCPALTVLFGYLLLGEPVTFEKLAGMVIILGAVYGVYRSQQKSVKKAPAV